jgi:hypothetical protein
LRGTLWAALISLSNRRRLEKPKVDGGVSSTWLDT